MKNHTTELHKRAIDIADREAEKVWQRTGNFDKYVQKWVETYENVLKEFQN